MGHSNMGRVCVYVRKFPGNLPEMMGVLRQEQMLFRHEKLTIGTKKNDPTILPQGIDY